MQKYPIQIIGRGKAMKIVAFKTKINNIPIKIEIGDVYCFVSFNRNYYEITKLGLEGDDFLIYSKKYYDDYRHIVTKKPPKINCIESDDFFKSIEDGRFEIMLHEYNDAVFVKGAEKLKEKEGGIIPFPQIKEIKSKNIIKNEIRN